LSNEDEKALTVLGYLFGCNGVTSATGVLANIHKFAAYMVSEGTTRQCDPSEIVVEMLGEANADKQHEASKAPAQGE
jgi:hypothetical protein